MLTVTFVISPNKNISLKIGTNSDITRTHIKSLRLHDISKEEIMECLNSVPLTVSERKEYSVLLKEFLDKL